MINIIFHSSQIFIYFLKDLLNQFPLIYETKIIPFIELNESLLYQAISNYNVAFIPIIFNFIKQISYNLLQTILYNIDTLIFFFPNILITAFIFFISTFLLLIDYEKIHHLLNQTIPVKYQILINTIKNNLTSSLLKLLSITFICSLCSFIISMIGLYLLDLPHIFWMSLAIALIDSLPLAGTSLIMIPWIIFTFLSNQVKLACGLSIVALILMMSHTILENHLLGKKMGIPPFLLFIAIMISQQFFGLFITLFIPLIIFIIQDILNQITKKSP